MIYSVLAGAVALVAQAAFSPSFTLATGGLILMVAPVAFTLAGPNWRDRRHLLLVCTILIALVSRSLFAYQMPSFVGTDAPAHLYVTNQIASEGRIDLSEPRGLSLEFPHMYFLFAMLQQYLGSALASLSVWLAPVVNTIGTLFLFLFARRCIGERAALLATLFFSLEYFSIFFGFEYRTQAYALIFLLGALYILFRRERNTGLSVALFVFSIGLATSHAVTAALGLLTLLLLAAANMLLRVPLVASKLGNSRLIGAEIHALTLAAFLLGYVAFVAPTLTNGLPYVIDRLTRVTSEGIALASNVQGIAVTGYLPLVQVVQWAVRISFVVSFVALCLTVAKRQKPRLLMVALIALFYGGVLVIDTVVFGLLSSGRWGMFFNIPLSIVLAWGVRELLWARWRMRVLSNAAARVLLVTALVAYALGNVAKLPTWLVGTPIGPAYDFRFGKAHAELASFVHDVRASEAPPRGVCAGAAGAWLLKSIGVGVEPSPESDSGCLYVDAQELVLRRSGSVLYSAASPATVEPRFAKEGRTAEVPTKDVPPDELSRIRK